MATRDELIAHGWTWDPQRGWVQPSGRPGTLFNRSQMNPDGINSVSYRPLWQQALLNTLKVGGMAAGAAAGLGALGAITGAGAPAGAGAAAGATGAAGAGGAAAGAAQSLPLGVAGASGSIGTPIALSVPHVIKAGSIFGAFGGPVPAALEGAKALGGFLSARAAGRAREDELAEQRREFDAQHAIQQQQLAIQQGGERRTQQGFDARNALLMSMLPQASNFRVQAPNTGPLTLDNLRNTPISAYVPQMSGGTTNLIPEGGIPPGVLAQLQAILARGGK